MPRQGTQSCNSRSQKASFLKKSILNKPESDPKWPQWGNNVFWCKPHSPSVREQKPDLAKRSAVFCTRKLKATTASRGQALKGHLSKFSGVCIFLVQYRGNFTKGRIGQSYRQALYTKKYIITTKQNRFLRSTVKEKWGKDMSWHEFASRHGTKKVKNIDPQSG